MGTTTNRRRVEMENEEKLQSDEIEENHDEESERSRLYIAIVGALLLAGGLILSFMLAMTGTGEILYGLALALTAVPVLWDAAKHFKKNPFNGDILMSLAAVGAALMRVWEEGAAVLILYNFAEAIEDFTVDRVRRIAQRIASLLPKRALVKKNGNLVEVPVEELQVGQILVAKPGWRIPIDGTIISGSSNVDQSSITGESIPVEKSLGDEILSGSLNLEGSLEIRVEKPFLDSTVSRVIKLVTEARERKANIETTVDKFSRYYTPSMMALAALIALIPPLVLAQPFSTWLYRALIVLIIACPSAFVIATPVTVLIGLTRAMWSGILVKGGIYLEELSRTQSVDFDKTGTLTMGKLKVSEIKAFNGYESKEMLRLAAQAECLSSHPIGAAIVKEAKEQGLAMDAKCEVAEVAGKGVKATLDRRTILVGKPSFLKENEIDTSALSENDFQSSGTTVSVAVDRKLAGLIVVADQIRSEAKDAVEALKGMGMKRVDMLTGDNEATAKDVAQKLGLTGYHASLLPEDKVKIVREHREEYGSVMMVGDGVNDAPVLAVSNVGIAMGTAGNDIAIEAADVALMGSDLRAIPYTMRLGRKVVRTLKVNIALTLGFKFLMIVLGALGLIPLWFSVIGDDGITLIVIANALPLLRFKD